MRISLIAGALLIFLSTPLAASAQAETLEVLFDLDYYEHDSWMSFSQGCINNPVSGRNNYTMLHVVWIEDASGNYVTTLHRWGRTYEYNLVAWAAATGMTVDGVTSATPTSDPNIGTSAANLRSQQRTVFTRDDQGTAGSPARRYSTAEFSSTPMLLGNPPTTGPADVSWLPDGTYQIWIESTQCELAAEWRGTPSLVLPEAGPVASFTWVKDRASAGNQPSPNGNTGPFTNVSVNWVIPGGNTPPNAWAGPDQRVPAPGGSGIPATISLAGRVDDPASAPTVQWTLLGSLPAGLTANILSPTAAASDVELDTAGIYTFQLSATDSGGATTTDEVEIYLNTFEVEIAFDGEYYSGNVNNLMGLLNPTPGTGNTTDGAGPWMWAWGIDDNDDNWGNNGSTNRSRTYLTFDLPVPTGTLTFARMRLPFGEASPDPNLHRDFYLVEEAQEDAGDWELTRNWTNQPVLNGRLANLGTAPLVGSATHTACLPRHSYSANGDSSTNIGQAATICPPWVDVDLDLALIGANDTNDRWTLYVTPREMVAANGMGFATRENEVAAKLVAVEFWQSQNNPPTADAGADLVVTDAPAYGMELVTFDGSGSSDDAGLVSFEWREGASLLGVGSTPGAVTAPLSLGIHDIDLTVTDGGGLSDTDTVQVIVDDRFRPNSASNRAATVFGTSAGRLYSDLFAYQTDPNGDWYSIDLVDGSDLRVDVTMAGGDLDLNLFNPDGSTLGSSATASLTETVSGTGLAAGSYQFQVVAPGGSSTYEMTITVTGANLGVTLMPATAVESAGTLTGAGTVTLDSPAAADVVVTLSSSEPTQLGFGGTSPVTIPSGSSSATFDIVLTDDPAGIPDVDRSVSITAAATNYNRGSADFLISDDEAGLFVSWDKLAETADEEGSPTIVLSAILSSTATSPVTIPFTVGGTATSGADYSIPGGLTSLTIAGGSAQATLAIAITNDDLADGNETVTITMGSPTGALVGGSDIFTLTIQDADGTDGGSSDGGDGDGDGKGCGCNGSRGNAAFGLALVALLLTRRRRS